MCYIGFCNLRYTIMDSKQRKKDRIVVTVQQVDLTHLSKRDAWTGCGAAA